jgi:hypothetical protein
LSGRGTSTLPNNALLSTHYEHSRTHLSLKKDAPSLARSPRQAMALWWRSPKSADFIIGTNAARPDHTAHSDPHHGSPRSSGGCATGLLWLAHIVGAQASDGVLDRSAAS